MNIIQYQLEIWNTLRFPQNHSSIDKMRAYFFVAVYFIGFTALFGSVFHYISGLITTLLIQLVEVIFVAMYAFNLNDYSEKNMDAMTCERSCNPLVEAYVAVRVLQIIQVFYMRSYPFLLVLLFLSSYVAWKACKGNLQVDATSLWRQIKEMESISYILLGIEIFLLIFSMVSMILSLIWTYSD